MKPNSDWPAALPCHKRFMQICLWLVVLLLPALTPAAPFDRSDGLAGLWFDPAQEGEGFNVLVTDTSLVVTFFGYSDGQQRWLISDLLPLDSVEQAVMSGPVVMFVANDGGFNAPVASSELQNWGTLRVQFNDCSTGIFELQGQDGFKRSEVIKVSSNSASGCDAPKQCGPDNVSVSDFDIADGVVTDPDRDRELAYRLYFPTEYQDCSPIILVSHGGDGNFTGHTRLTHLGSEFASRGYVALHINHRPSTVQAHVLDRPADVSFMLDALLDGRIQLPELFSGQLAADRVGHIGHSFGAYTSHAVAGAITQQGVFVDPRIRAIVPLSPQGEDVFGFFGHQQRNNSWRSITLPSLVMIGELEIDTRPLFGFIADGWRLQPFLNYPDRGDKWQIILADQDHGDIGSQGSPEVQSYIAANARRFFDAFVRGVEEAACEVGNLNMLPDTEISRLTDPLGLLVACP